VECIAVTKFSFLVMLENKEKEKYSNFSYNHNSTTNYKFMEKSIFLENSGNVQCDSEIFLPTKYFLGQISTDQKYKKIRNKLPITEKTYWESEECIHTDNSDDYVPFDPGNISEECSERGPNSEFESGTNDENDSEENLSLAQYDSNLENFSLPEFPSIPSEWSGGEISKMSEISASEMSKSSSGNISSEPSPSKSAPKKKEFGGIITKSMTAGKNFLKMIFRKIMIQKTEKNWFGKNIIKHVKPVKEEKFGQKPHFWAHKIMLGFFHRIPYDFSSGRMEFSSRKEDFFFRELFFLLGFFFFRIDFLFFGTVMFVNKL